MKTRSAIAVICVLLGIRAGEAVAQPAVTPIESRIDVVLGRAIVTPVEMSGRARAGSVDLRLDDGRFVRGELVWISFRPAPRRCSGPGWIDDPPIWEVSSEGGGNQGGALGRWFLIVDPPLNAIGQGLWIGGVRFDLNWLPDPISIGGSNPDPAMWAPQVGLDAVGDESLLELLEPESRGPLRSWRYRLAVDGLRPRGILGESDSFVRPTGDIAALQNELRPEGTTSRVLASLRRQTEARWQVALGWLWLADPSVARRLRAALGGSVVVGTGAAAPVWFGDQSSLDQLRRQLLEPDATPQARIRAAEEWLERTPAALAWTIDDSGRTEAVTGHLQPTVGVVNLAPGAEIGAASTRGEPVLTTVLPRRQTLLTGSLPVDRRTEQRLMMTPLDVSVGTWSTQVAVLTQIAPLRPPGLRTGALLNDWTMRSWSSGRTDLDAFPPPDRSTIALLYRGQRSAGAVGGGASNGAWTLYVECHDPDLVAGSGRDRDDELRIWLGPFGEPVSVLRVRPDGSVVDERDVMAHGQARPRWVDVSHERGYWAFKVTLPDEAVESDGVLRLGLERLDACGRRTSWPRRMLPWQIEPGRIAIDTSTWLGFDG